MKAENTADAPAARDLERMFKPINGIFPELMEERIKVNLEPLNEQISTLTQLLKQVDQETLHVTPEWWVPGTHKTESSH